MKKISVVIDLSKKDYIESYIEKTEFNKTKIYNKNEVEKLGMDGCNNIDTFKTIQSISKAYNLAIKNVNDKFMSNKSPFGLLTNKEYERLEEERY